MLHPTKGYLTAALLAFVAGTSGCRTTAGMAKAQTFDLNAIPTNLGCQSGDGLMPCVSFDQGRGGDTSEPIEAKGLQTFWIGDLAQLYEFYEMQLGKEFDKEHSFAGLDLEVEQILVVADEQSLGLGKKIAVTKIEDDGDTKTVFVEQWIPTRKGSGCNFFSRAVARPYHMIKIKKELSFVDGRRPEIEINAKTKYYRCPNGEMIE